MLNFKIRLNYRSIIHYLLIYLLISFQKGVFARALGNNFLVLVFVISIVFFINNLNLIAKYGSFFIMLFLSLYIMMITMLTTGGSLSFMTIMRYIVCFVFVLVAIKFDEKNFLERYLKLILFISIISIIAYELFAILHVNLYSKFYWKDGYYGLFLFNFNPTSANVMRNIGISNEPGQFQIIVSSALYFSLFKYKFKTNRKFLVYVSIFIITLLTVQSTTGYFALLAILLAFIFSKSNNAQKRKIKYLIMASILLGAIYVYMNWGESNFITSNFINKVFNDDFSINLNQNTGGARIESMIADLSMARDYPLGMGFELYESLWYEYAPANSGFLSCSGITRDIAIIGFLPVTVFLVFLIRGFWINRNSSLDFLLGTFLLVNTGLAQTQMLNPCLMLISMYSLVPFCKLKRRKIVYKTNQICEVRN